MTRFLVSGPDLPDGRRADSASVGLSAAVTYASRASRAGRAETYYVRDPSGDLVGRADADGGGGVQVFGEGTILAYRVAQLPLPDRLDRASTSEIAASLVDGRPGSARPPREENVMAEAAKTRSGAKKATGAKKAETTSSAKPTAAPAAKGEKGTDLMAALMQQVETKVPGMKKETNKSQTMTRLVAPNGKSFAVVFPPRKNGLAVKIPKQLLRVEGDLPTGHGFHRTNWGLTRTITKASEAPAVAGAFAVAAAAVTDAPTQGEGGES